MAAISLYIFLISKIILHVRPMHVQVCDILGVVETDYFGLCYKDKYGLMWLNKRVLLRHQLKEHRPPYLLDMRVKFYVPQTAYSRRQLGGWQGVVAF